MAVEGDSPETLDWAAPGAGQWWLELEHFAKPVSGLFADLFPPTSVGWSAAARRFGQLQGDATWGAINGWLYYLPGEADTSAIPALEEAARATLEEARWRDELTEWFDRDRPRIVAHNRALQLVDVASLADDALADHVDACLTHLTAVYPVHFEHAAFRIAFGLLVTEAAEHGIDGRDVFGLLTGGSTSSWATVAYLDEIANALHAAGVTAVGSLDDVRSASAPAAAALESYLDVFGWRTLDTRDIADPTLIERPDVVVACIRARLVADRELEAATRARLAAREAEVLARVPDDRQAAFAQLLDETRRAYAIEDDDEGVAFLWPNGLVRRAALELGRRLQAAARIESADHVFDCTATELRALGRPSNDAPSRHELAGRRRRRDQSARATPPPTVGEPPPPSAAGPELPPNMARIESLTSLAGSLQGERKAGHLTGTGIGSVSYRGRARLVESSPDGIATLEPGDVLVVSATTPGYNAVFPILGAIVTEFGGIWSHAAVMAREFDLPAVVGVTGACSAIRDGDTIEVDPAASEVRVV